MQLWITPINARRSRAESRPPHQAHHATATRGHALVTERAQQSRAAVLSAMGDEQPLDVLEQNPVPLRVRTPRAAHPRVIARAGDAVERTEPA